jgi:FlaA1/EpsC-like NDP-sugar epimerase
MHGPQPWLPVSPVEDEAMKNSYGRFAAMIGTATVLMYGATYFNTYRLAHVRFSETRVYMSLMMGAMMAAVMLALMGGMYRRRHVNIGIYVASAVGIVLAVWLVRSQSTVQDVSYMRAMIPHHSIAILTSERAEISDPRVRELADQIIATQRREIAEMERLITELTGEALAR